ncbi:MAG TPA: oxygenase MpaB family protein [Patescibacteria group bacterium]|nr:oxygenase MpaB family protein [Patescibacteria group bacterium]
MKDVVTPVDFTFKKDGMLWDVDRESALLAFGGQRALFMQLAHPLVGQAVYEHSYFKENTVKRLKHTINLTYSLIFGTREETLAAARKINQAHKPVEGVLTENVGEYLEGTRYDAKDPELTEWVWATLVDTALIVRSKFIKPLTPVERETYYQEAKGLLPLLGGNPDTAPATIDDFDEYMKDMLTNGKLVVSNQARELAPYLMLKNRSAAARIFILPASKIAVGLLPEELRNQYGFTFSSWEQYMLDKTADVSRKIHPYIPDRIRFSPFYLNAQKKMRK